MIKLDELETIRSIEYYKLTNEETKRVNLLMILNGINVYQLQNGKWTLKPGLYNYLFNNDDSLDIIIEPLTFEAAVKEGLDRKVEIIINAQYYKVVNEKMNRVNYIMVLNNEYAYQLQNDGKWKFKAGLYNYLFNNDDSLDRIIEPLNLKNAIKEEITREKTFEYKKSER